MEAVVFFIFFGVYIMIRVLLGGGETSWEKSARRHQKNISKWLEQGNTPSSYFDGVLAKNPTDVFALVSLGNCYLQDNMPEKALVLAQRAIRLENSVSEVHLLMSKGLYQLGEWPSALTYAKNAVWFNRQHSEAKNWLGKLCLATGDIDQGMQHLESSFALEFQEKKRGIFIGRNQNQIERKTNKYN